MTVFRVFFGNVQLEDIRFRDGFQPLIDIFLQQARIFTGRDVDSGSEMPIFR